MALGYGKETSRGGYGRTSRPVTALQGAAPEAWAASPGGDLFDRRGFGPGCYPIKILALGAGMRNES